MNLGSASFRPAPLLQTLAFVALAAFGIRTISNGDFWVHLATGRLLVESGWVRSDPFSFTTDTSRAWIQPNWLYDALLFFVWRVGGATGAVLLTIIPTLLAFGLIGRLVRETTSGANRACALLLMAWILAPSFVPGPATVALLLLSIFIRILSKGVSPRGLIPLLPLQIAWTNLHPSFLLGPAIALLFAFERREAKKNESFLTAAALLAGTIANPYGLRMHELAYKLFLDSNMGALMDWISPFQSEFPLFLLRAPLFTAIAVLAIGFVTYKDRLPMGLTVLGVAGAFLAVLSPRYWLFAALFMYPLTAISLRSITARIEERLNLAVWAPAGRGFLAGASALTLFLVTSGFYFNRIGSASAFGLGIEEEAFPVKACETILAHPDFPARAINLAHDGGYLAWTFPQRRIFCDTRMPVYGASFFQGLARALVSDGTVLTNLLNRFDPGAFILSGAWPGAGLAARRLIDTGEWAPAYFDGTTFVLLRRDPAHEKMLEDFDIQRKGLHLLETTRRAYLRDGSSPLPQKNSVRLMGAGNVYYALGRYQEAQAVCEVVTMASPTLASAWTKLGISSFQLGDYDRAVRELERAVDLQGDNAVAYLWLSRAYAKLGQSTMADRMQARAFRLNPKLGEALLKEAYSPPQAAPAPTLPAPPSKF